MSRKTGIFIAGYSFSHRQRQIDREVNQMAEADRDRFRYLPGRRWLLRRAIAAEVEEDVRAGRFATLPPGWTWFTAVRRIGPAVFVRNVFAGPAEFATDRSDHEIARLLPPAYTDQFERLDAEFPEVPS